MAEAKTTRKKIQATDQMNKLMSDYFYDLDAAAKAIQGTLAAACQAVDPQTLLPELVGQLAQGALKAKA